MSLVHLFAEGIVCLREVALYETNLTNQQVNILIILCYEHLFYAADWHISKNKTFSLMIL